MPVVRTADVGIDQQGNVEVYVPPNVTVMEQGASVSYGQWQDLAEGTQIGPGTFEMQGGTLEAVGSGTQVRSVTITT